MAKTKKIKLTLTLPEVMTKSEPTEWYSKCISPTCGHKTKCDEDQELSRPVCGYFVIILPCSVKID